jgi:hypothetical protein
MRNNGDISPVLQESIDFVLSSNLVLDFWADHLRKREALFRSYSKRSNEAARLTRNQEWVISTKQQLDQFFNC